MNQQQGSDERIAHWRGVVEQWQDSGMSKAGFCRENEVPVWQFYYWVKRLSELDGNDAGFARVSAAGSGVCLRLGGVRLEIEPGFDEATVKRLVTVLAASC